MQALAQLRRYTTVDEVGAIQYFLNGLKSSPAFHEKALDYQLLGQAPTMEVLYGKMRAWERLFREHPSPLKGEINYVPAPAKAKEEKRRPESGARTTAQLLAKLSSQLGTIRRAQEGLQRDVRNLKGAAQRGNSGGRYGNRREWQGRSPQNTPQWTDDGRPICLCCKKPGHMRWECEDWRKQQQERRKRRSESGTDRPDSDASKSKPAQGF